MAQIAVRLDHMDNDAGTCTIRSMLLDSPLAVITPTVDGDVLAVLARADASFTPPTVQALIGRHSVEGVRKALHRLVEQGIVDADRVGNAVNYRLNRDHLAAGPIIELANLRTALFDRISDRVQTWSLPARLVMLFGSAATATMRTDSDIDLFVVGNDDDVGRDAWQTQVGELEAVVSRWTGNDTRVLEYSVGDLKHRRDPVVHDIRRDGIVITGDRSLLNRSRRNGS
jgi:predicted nucleotidyltransferase